MAIFRGDGGAGDSTTDASLSAIAAQSASATAKALEAQGYRDEAVAAQLAAEEAKDTAVTVSEDFEKGLFKSDEAPTGADVDEGDIWYDKDDDQLKVYRELTPNVFAWVPIILGPQNSDSDTLDAGNF